MTKSVPDPDDVGLRTPGVFDGGHVTCLMLASRIGFGAVRRPAARFAEMPEGAAQRHLDVRAEAQTQCGRRPAAAMAPAMPDSASVTRSTIRGGGEDLSMTGEVPVSRAVWTSRSAARA